MLTNEQRLPVTPEVAWRSLNDVDVLKACIPGCDSVRALSASRFAVVVRAALGPVTAKVRGELHVLVQDDLHPPSSYTVRFEGRGRLTGRVRGEARVQLERHGADQCSLRYAAEATLDGGLVQLGAIFIDRAAQGLADAFFAAFNARMRRSATLSA